MIEFTVPGPPGTQRRSRLFTAGGRARAAKHPTTLREQARVREYAEGVRPEKPLQGPLRVSIHAAFPVARSWPAWRQEAAIKGAVQHTARPDADNVGKLVLDALTQSGWWRDDSQVVELTVRKVYSDRPRTVVSVVELAQVGSAKEWRASP